MRKFEGGVMVRAGQLVVLTTLLFSALAFGQPSVPGAPSVPPSAEQTALGAAFDVRAAVDAYLAKMPPARRARSDAYFEGGYWLILWDFLSTVLVMWLLLHFCWSARMRDLAERLTRLRPLQTVLYWVQFFVVVSVLTFPLSVYEGYFREHKYGLLNQSSARGCAISWLGSALAWCWEPSSWCRCLGWSDA